MTPVASIYGPGCDSQKLRFTQSDVRGEPVSIVSAGLAYQGIRTTGATALALRKGVRMWQNAESRCLELRQLHQAAGVEPRAARKLDRFSLLALAAAKAAVSQSKLDPRDMSGCGIYSGNMVGGWTFTEPQVRALHRDGLDAVSPYLATAWFPGAPQGQISINLGMMGFAKTVTTDRCSGAQAIGLAYERIRAGLPPSLLLAGGAEAPVTPFVTASLAQISNRNDSTMEGAAYLLLMSGARGEVQITGHSTFAVNMSLGSGEPLTQRIARSITQLGIKAPDFVLCNLPIDEALEKDLAKCIRKLFGSHAEIFFTTEIFGDALAASGPLACVSAWELLTEIAISRSALVISLGHQCADLLNLSKSDVSNSLVENSGGQVS
jgi:3-oxoacyl-(acyl-carrier-protein) synthase